MPAFCDGFGSQSSMEHALDCRIGGLVIQRHNEIRDAMGDLVYKEVIREPVVREADDKSNVLALTAELGVRSCWQPQVVTLFDVRVVDTDAKSYVQHNVEAVLSSAEHTKHSTFTPFVVSVDGVLGHEARMFVNHLGDSIADVEEIP